MARSNTCKCGKEIEESRKGQRHCKECHAAYMRENRKAYSELSPEQRLKVIARSTLNVSIRRGAIKREACEVCGSLDTEAHHEDYSKPLEVRWLCRDHHMAEHSSLHVPRGTLVNLNPRFTH